MIIEVDIVVNGRLAHELRTLCKLNDISKEDLLTHALCLFLKEDHQQCFDPSTRRPWVCPGNQVRDWKDIEPERIRIELDSSVERGLCKELYLESQLPGRSVGMIALLSLATLIIGAHGPSWEECVAAGPVCQIAEQAKAHLRESKGDEVDGCT